MMEAEDGHPRQVGPPPGMAFDLDEWVTCESYLGCIEQKEINTATNLELARVVAKLHGRHEGDHGAVNGERGNAEVYVKINPMGLVLRVITSHQVNEESDGGQREGIREFFETVRIARCSANHEPCTRALIWVYNRQVTGGSRLMGTGEGRVECHGVVCRDLEDATRLANTLAMAFYKSRELPSPRGNTLGAAVGGAVATSGLQLTNNTPAWSQPLAYSPSQQGGGRGQQLPPLRVSRGRQNRVLEIAPVHRDDANNEENSDQDPSPRSTGSTSPRTRTPRNKTSTPSVVGNSTVSLNSSDDSGSPRGHHHAVNMRNSTVSLHSAVAVSERGLTGRGRGRRSGGLPDVDADSWLSPVSLHH